MQLQTPPLTDLVQGLEPKHYASQESNLTAGLENILRQASLSLIH